MRVEVGDRQFLHAAEHIITHIAKYVIGDHHHDLSLEEVRQYAKSEDNGDSTYPVCKAREIFISADQKRLDIIVDQISDEHVTQHGSD